MTDLGDIYFTEGAAGDTLMRCKRCNDNNRDLAVSVKGLSLSEITELSVRHIASHADEDVKAKAPLDNDEVTALAAKLAGELEEFSAQLQAEVREFGERIVREYGPEVQQAVTKFGFKRFFG